MDTEALAERVRAHGMQGRVTIGHVTTLAAMSLAEQSSALDLLAAAGIALVLLPRHGSLSCRPRAQPRPDRARPRAARVRVAIAKNNIQNPLAPFGNGNLLHAAWLAAITRRVCAAASLCYFLDAITSKPTAILGLSEHGPVAGAPAHLAIVDALRGEDVLSLAPPVLATLREGRLVHSLAGAISQT